MNQSLHTAARNNIPTKTHSPQFSSSSLQDGMNMYFEKFSVNAYKKLLILLFHIVPFKNSFQRTWIHWDHWDCYQYTVLFLLNVWVFFSNINLDTTPKILVQIKYRHVLNQIASHHIIFLALYGLGGSVFFVMKSLIQLPKHNLFLSVWREYFDIVYQMCGRTELCLYLCIPQNCSKFYILNMMFIYFLTYPTIPLISVALVHI